MTKQQLLKYFKEDDFKLIRKSSWIYKLAKRICECILHIEIPTLIFQNIEEDGRYYNQLNVIALNAGYLDDELELKKSLYHELRHSFQLNYINNNDNELSNLFKSDFNNINNSQFTIIDLDAYAFEYDIAKQLDNIELHHPNLLLDELINKYKLKYYNKFFK